MGAYTWCLTKLSRFKLIIIVILTSIILISVTLYGLVISERIIEIDETWLEHDKEVASEASLVIELSSYLGPSGFKRYINEYSKHKDKKLLHQADKLLIQSSDVLDKLDSLHANEGDLNDAINEIRKILNAYIEGVLTLGKGRFDSSATFENIDDKALSKAMDILYRHFSASIKVNSLYIKETVDSLKLLSLIGMSIILLVVISAGVIALIIRFNLKTNNLLTEKSEDLRSIINAIPDALYIINEQGEIIDVNQNGCDLLGYQRNEILNMQVESLMPERYRKGHRSYVNKSFTKSERRAMNAMGEFYAMRKDGTEFPVDISINYKITESGSQAITIMRDITERRNVQQKLIRSENMLSKGQQLVELGSWEWNLETREYICSAETFKIFGFLDSKGCSYDQMVDIVHPDDREEFISMMKTVIEKETSFNIEHRIIRKDGESRYVHQRGEVIKDPIQTTKYVIGTIVDITEKKRTEIELMLADSVFNHASEAILVTDVNNKILRVNKAFTKITGYSYTEVIGKSPNQILKSGKHDLDFYAEMWRDILADGQWQGEIYDRRKDGTIFPCWHNISAVRDETGKYVQYISIFSDITDKKATEERIHYLAQYDQLTGLPNRILFKDRLDTALHRARRHKTKLALLFIDLDGFKQINDTLGHQAGDTLLEVVAKRLTNTVRTEDTVARMGGDEFTIILEEVTSDEGVARVCNKIITKISEVIEIGVHETNIGCSIGVSIYPIHGTNDQILIKHADMAMYKAKKDGKNRYQFYDDI